MSFLPIFFYTAFLYLYKRSNFFPELPQRFSMVAMLFSLVLIPVIIATNEVGSFIGNTYSTCSYADVTLS